MGPQTLSELLMQMKRPGLLSRGATQAAARTADISDFLEGPYASIALPGLFLGRKAREFLSPEREAQIQAPKEEFRKAAAALPPAQGFGEKAADFIGNALPDVALGFATGPVAAGVEKASALASPLARFAVGQAAQSAALAPIEFGTRDPASAALNTIVAPLAGTLLHGALGKLFGRGAKAAVEEVAPPTPFTQGASTGFPTSGTAFPDVGPRGFSQTFNMPERPPALPPPPPMPARPMTTMGQALTRAAEQAQPLTAYERKALEVGQFSLPFESPEAMRAAVRSQLPAEPLFATADDVLAKAQGAAPRTEAPTADIVRLANYTPQPPPALVESIRQQGILEPLQIGVNPETGTRILFEGKHRLAAAQELGLPSVPVREVSIGSGLEDALKKEGAAPKIRTYYITPDGAVHTNAVAGAAKVRAPSRTAARLAIQASPQEVVQEAAQGIPPEIAAFDRAHRIAAQQRIKDALIAGRPILSGDLIELGDAEITATSREAMQEMLRASIDAMTRAGIPLKGVAKLTEHLTATAENMPPKINAEIADALDSLPSDAAARMLQKLKGKGICPI